MLENGTVKNKINCVDVVCTVEKRKDCYNTNEQDVFVVKRKDNGEIILEVGSYFAEGYDWTLYSDYYPENIKNK